MNSFRILCPNDELIQRVVPHYVEIVDLMVRLLPTNPPPVRILDLGAGPGRISEVIHGHFPAAQLVLLDAGEAVLDIARERMAAVAPDFIVGDFTTADLGQGYDTIVAGLTLHHLDEPGKQAMITRLRDALADGGHLIISDIVRGSTPDWDRRYEEMWLNHISELPAQQHSNVVRHYREQDRPSRVEDQLDWLKLGGFTEVACHWRHLNFAVWSGGKPALG